MTTQQKSFTSSLGAIMAAVGSAVGLGNIWRFPYTCGKYGGGAFLLVYCCFVFLIGSVLMMSEFIIGRRAQHTPVKAFQTLAPRHKAWGLLGLLGLFDLNHMFLFLRTFLLIFPSGVLGSSSMNSSSRGYSCLLSLSLTNRAISCLSSSVGS